MLLQFLVELYGYQEHREMFAHFYEVGVDPVVMLVSIREIEAAFGKEKTGSPRQMLNMMITASKKVEASLDAFAVAAAKLAPSLAKLGVERGMQAKPEATPVDELVAQFEIWLGANRSAGHTRRTAGLVKQAAGEIGKDTLARWTVAAIEGFLTRAATERGWQPATRARARQAVGRFLGWAARRGEISHNPISQVERPRIRRREVRPPMRRDIVRLVRAARNYDTNLRRLGRKTWLEFAVRVGLGTGMRAGELFQVEWRDADLRAGEVVVRAEISKSGRERTVPLTRLARGAFERASKTDDSREGRVVRGPRSESARLKALRVACERGSIPRVTWQTLRQWYCSWLAMAGVPMPDVQRLAGHADITRTARHYTAVTRRHIRREIERAGV